MPLSPRQARLVEKRWAQRVLHWVNTLDTPSCLLVSWVDELSNGDALCDVVCRLLRRQSVPGTVLGTNSASTCMGNVRRCLALLDRHGYEVRSPLPPGGDVARAFVLGELNTTLIVFAYLQHWFHAGDDPTPSVEALAQAARLAKPSGSPKRSRVVRYDVCAGLDALSPCRCGGSGSGCHCSPSPVRPRARSPSPQPQPPAVAPVTPTQPAADMSLASLATPGHSLLAVDGVEPLSKAQQLVLQWLVALEVPIPYPAQSAASFVVVDVADSFRTGVLLCDLVERMDRMPEAIPGVQHTPKTRAALLANVNRALEILRSKPKMNQRFLWRTEDIVDGHTAVIWGLLEDMYRNYHRSRPNAPTAQSRVSTGARSRSPVGGGGPALGQTLTEEQEARVRKWLRRLRFPFPHPASTHGNANRLIDGWSNGYLLCALVDMLDGQGAIISAVEAPEGLDTVRSNFGQAYAVLGRRGVPAAYLQDATGLVWHLNRPALIELLWHVFEAFPEALSFDEPVQPAPKGKYTAAQQEALERSLLEWLHDLGLLAAVPESLDDVMDVLLDGVLLCDLLQLVQRNKPVSGVFRPPRSQATRAANVTRAIEGFRRQRNMSRRAVSREEAILAGDRGAMLGLLEDIRRLIDGVAPRPSRLQRGEKPYLGHARHIGRMVVGRGRRTRAPRSLDETQATAGDEDRDDAYGDAGDEELSPYERSCDFADEYLGKSTRDAPRSKAYEEVRAVLADVSGNSDALRVGEDSDESFGAAEIEAIHPWAEVESVIRWIERVGITIEAPEDLAGPVAPEFCDGVLLCDLVGKLQHSEIKGVTRAPRSRASHLYNINKCLEALRLNNAMAIDHLWSADEIRDGNTRVILPLLQDIRRAFPNFYCKPRRPACTVSPRCVW